MNKQNRIHKKFYLSGNILFTIMIVIAFLFAISPLLLKISWIASTVSLWLGALNIESYKSTYINTMGALLGTFLAVSGALWTQQKENKVKEDAQLKEMAFMLSLELTTVINELLRFENAYAFISPGRNNNFDDVVFFIKYKKDIYIDIDDEWKNKVFKLSSILSHDEIQILYNIYVDLSFIKSVWDLDDRLIEKKDAHKVYNTIRNDLCASNITPSFKAEWKIENKEIVEKLNIFSNKI